MFHVLPVGGLALPFSPLESILPGQLYMYVVKFILSRQVKQKYIFNILKFILKTLLPEAQKRKLRGHRKREITVSLDLNRVFLKNVEVREIVLAPN